MSETRAREMTRDRPEAAEDDPNQAGRGSLQPESNARYMLRWSVGIVAVLFVVYLVWVALASVIDAQM